MIRTNLFLGAVLFPAVLSLFCIFPGSARSAVTITADREDVAVDFFYHGSTVTFSGALDARDGDDDPPDVIVTIASPDRRQVMKKKGRIGGLLWMNTGELVIDHVPNVYLLHSTGAVEDILSPEEREAYGVGYGALYRRAVFTPALGGDEKTAWYNEFIRFKEASRLYVALAGTVTVVRRGDGPGYRLSAQWPYQVPPGEYTATVYAVRNGKVSGRAETAVRVRQVGIVRALAELAKAHGALYGLTAIFIALAAGFGVGLIFRKGGGSH